jgi:hypothetical protein
VSKFTFFFFFFAGRGIPEIGELMQASFPIDPKFRKSIAPNIWYCKEEEKKKDGEREKEKKRERKRRRKWRKIRDRGRGRRYNFRS